MRVVSAQALSSGLTVQRSKSSSAMTAVQGVAPAPEPVPRSARRAHSVRLQLAVEVGAVTMLKARLERLEPLEDLQTKKKLPMLEAMLVPKVNQISLLIPP